MDTQSFKDNDPMYYFPGLSGIDPVARDLTENSVVSVVPTTNETLTTIQAYDVPNIENQF